jgi:hypothetical protein
VTVRQCVLYDVKLVSAVTLMWREARSVMVDIAQVHATLVAGKTWLVLASSACVLRCAISAGAAFPAPSGHQFYPSACSPRRKDAKIPVTYATTPTRVFYLLHQERRSSVSRAFFRRFVARLLYLDSSWGGCSGFVDYIIGLFALRFLRSGRSLLFCILSLSFSFRLQ